MARQLDSFVDSSGASSGIIIATIADNLDDPKEYKETGKMIGRVKLSITGVSDEIDKKDLPWAYVMSPIGSGTHDGIGGFQVPAIGTQVVCMKLNTQNGYIVLGELNSTKHKLKDYNKDYPETYGVRDKTGNKTVTNMKTGDSFQQQAGGTWLNINKESTDAKISGHVVIEAKKVTIKGDLYVTGSIKSAGDHVAGMTSLRSHIHVVPAKPGSGVPSFIPIPNGSPGTPDSLNTDVPINKSTSEDTYDSLSDRLDDTNSDFLDGVDRNTNDLNASTGDVMDDVLGTLNGAVNSQAITDITNGLSSLTNISSDILNTVNNITSVTNGLKGEVMNIASNFKGLASDYVDNLTNGVINNISGLNGLTNSFNNNINNSIGTVTNVIPKLTDSLNLTIFNELGELTNVISNNINSSLGEGEEFPTELFNNLGDELKNAATSCSGVAAGGMSKCSSSFKSSCSSIAKTCTFGCSQSCSLYTTEMNNIKVSKCSANTFVADAPNGTWYPSMGVVEPPHTSGTQSGCPDTRNGDFNPSYSPSVCNGNGYFWCSLAGQCLDKPINVPQCGEMSQR